VTRINEDRAEAAKLTGEASIALLFRQLSASCLVTIAQIEGRVRGAGSEFVLACAPFRRSGAINERRQTRQEGLRAAAPRMRRTARPLP
jgi:hypothetical protein